MPTINPLVLSKVVLWVAAVIAATLLLRRRAASPRVRLGFLRLGVVLFGFAYGALIPGGANPNPLLSLRNVLGALLSGRVLVPLVAVMLGVLLAMVLISNKSICGWGCQLGLLQGLIHRLPLPEWRPPFWLANSIRAVATLGLVAGLAWAGVDWIRGVDPFLIFSYRVTLGVGAAAGLVLVASAFVYRPWCLFLCPFGFVGWLAEQVSVLRPRIDWNKCARCRACVRACPTGAMADFYEGKKIHADCFACGACLSACPREGALGWAAPRGRERGEGT
ncbi:4Fe-4S binding protein [Candidatus Bipolaricaulota bacterium]|nr:4Fe-4S binding protein [Candidatus Bipolaricaulota bacterium]